jgi:peptidoglycan/xylan/chitin deacetylase (PgdA/CDA1 family)
VKNSIRVIRKLQLPIFFLLVLLTIPCEGRIRFSGLDLAEDDRLLLTAVSAGSGTVTQSALFYAQLPARSAVPLTAFPEKMELVEGGNTILVHNAFGSQRLPVTGGLPQTFSGFPGSGRTETAASPDGHRLLYVEPTSHARGTLILLDGASGRKIPVSFDVERPGRFFPAVWSADSRTFLYAKGGKLYFYTLQTTPPDERHRIIGDGAINSVCWSSVISVGSSRPGGTFYYLRGRSVYRIRSNELFARTPYGGFLEPGELAGIIPVEFDPNFDRFWIAPDGLSLILCKGGQNLFYFPLGTQETADFSFLPHMAPRSGARLDVLWSADGIATVLIAPPSGTGTLAYRFNTRGGGTAQRNLTFETLDSPPDFHARLSPDGRRAAFWGKDGLYMYDYRNWNMQVRLASSPVFSCLWLNNSELIVGGAERIESIRLSSNTAAERKLLCLASASRYGFEDPRDSKTGRIVAFSGDGWYTTNGETPWMPHPLSAVREAALASGQYRVYLEGAGGIFDNIPMVRNITSVGTFPLFEPITEPVFNPRPDLVFGRNPSRIDAAEENHVFSHGSRSGRQVAVCFDLYDDASGLTIVLDALNRFGIKATFFINGEFIRRHPEEARELAASGHETASMFFAPLDLSDARYRIDSNFVARGLARNEDEFYRTTGKELALLWHPPYYALSRTIAEAAAAAGYRTIGRDVDSRDWIRSADAHRLGIGELSAAEMIDNIMDAKQGGSIIPIRLGRLEGGRTDYLYNSIDVLLEALARERYEAVPVSALLGRL